MTLPRWTRNLRVRLTAGATLLAAVTFAAGGLLALTLYHNSLVDQRQRTARASANAVATRASGRDVPRPIPMPDGADIPRMQVLDSGNHVLNGDPASYAIPPMFVPRDRHTTQDAVVTAPWFIAAHRAYVIAIPVTTAQGALTVEAALPLDAADAQAIRATRQTALALAGSLVVVATLAWLVVGRALAPVEQMRARVASITAAGALTERLPVPAGSDELGRLCHTLNEMLRVLHESDRRQRQFVADAAHELRTPLAGITAFLEVAVHHPGTIGHEELARRLLIAHERLSDLVNDLLTLASVDAQAPVPRRPVDLSAVVRVCLGHVQAAVPVQTHLTGPVVVLGNESQLQRVVTNLLDNATRYARQTVRLALFTEEHDAVITVLDDGPGIPADKQGQIWQRFVRLDEDRSRAGGGVGLGLALVREIVNAHGGTASVTNADGGLGALFTVRLPLAPPTRGEQVVG